MLLLLLLAGLLVGLLIVVEGKFRFIVTADIQSGQIVRESDCWANEPLRIEHDVAMNLDCALPTNENHKFFLKMSSEDGKNKSFCELHYHMTPPVVGS